MHPFFLLLQHALTVPVNTQRVGVIVFRQLDEDLTYRLVMSPQGNTLESRDTASADLRIYCDTAQLDGWLRGHWERPVRYQGDAQWLEALATLLTPPQSPLATQADR